MAITPDGFTVTHLEYVDALKDVSALSVLTELHSLRLTDCCALKDVSALSVLTGLQLLDLRGCRAVEDVSLLSSLTRLRSLSLAGCKALKDLSALSGLTGLQSLGLSGWQGLEDLSVLSSLTDLSWLNLSGCSALEDLSALSSLTDMQSLNLCGCSALKEISTLSRLANLRWLDLRDACALNPLPGTAPLASWKGLEMLLVNQLLHAPRELGSHDYQDNTLPRIRAWQQALLRCEASNSVVKIFILGNGHVGKTQLLRRLCSFLFDETIGSTHGISIDSFSIPTPRADLPAVDANAWDFGGQDIYLGTHALFLDDRAIYVIAWNPRFENSDEYEKNGILFRNRPMGYWIEYVHSLAGPKVPVIVVQTQCERQREVRSPNIPKHPFQWIKQISSSAKADDGLVSLRHAISEGVAYLLEEYGKVCVPAS